MKSSMIIHPDEISKKWIDKLALCGVSTLGIHPSGGKDSVLSLTNLVKNLKTREYRELIDYAYEKGLTVEYEFHAAGYLLPRGLFSEHPEYFRVNKDGERTKDCNLCPSSKEAVGIFSKNAARLADELYKSAPRFYFWMDDGEELHCHCDRCKDLSASDQQLIVMNSVVKEIRKSIPEAEVAYLAYLNTLPPPKKILPEDGIFLEYAPFYKYVAKGENAQKLVENEKSLLPELLAFFNNSDKKVLEYWYDNSMLSVWKKPPRKFTLQKRKMTSDIAEYSSFGFDTVSTFACFLGYDYEELHGEVDVTPFGKLVSK